MATVTTDSRHYTDIADAIRAKGVSGSFLPAQMADAIGRISGGGLTVAGASRTEIVTVGANSVTTPVSALEYFGYAAPFPNLTIIALDPFTADAELGYFASRSTSGSTPMGWWRWRNNAINWPNTFNTSWDTRLVEGKKYLVIEW